jgi:hypothetical protein
MHDLLSATVQVAARFDVQDFPGEHGNHERVGSLCREWAVK